MIDRGGRFTEVPIRADGTFILALAGDRALRSARLRVTGATGTTVRPMGRPGGP